MKKGRCKMKHFNGYRIRFALVGFVAAVILSSGDIKGDFTFGPAENLGPPINSSSGEVSASITADGLELYFNSNRLGVVGVIWVSRRSTKDDEWGEPVELGPTVNTGGAGSASVTGDGLELYFVSNRTGGYGQSDIWVSKRQSKNSPWGLPENLGSPPNTRANLWSLSVSPDGLEVYFCSGSEPDGYGTSGGQDIFVTRRAHRGEPWSKAEALGPTINAPDADWENGQALSSDGLILIFSSSRLGGFSTMTDWNLDLWMARRETKEAPWGEALNLGPSINSHYSDMATGISADGRMLYFGQRSWEGYRPGGQGGADIWQAPIIPIVDLNNDGMVDVKDVVTLTDHWGENNSLCDIGPMPWGDGKVDVHDLLVLAEYLKPEPVPIAHWPLDETEGMVVEDAVGDNQAYAVGDPVWQPDGGKVGGAMLFDGVDDFVSTPAILNPADGPFSVFVWINGGAPGQVIAAQQTVSNWISLDTEGNLMTDLKCVGSSAAPLVSEAVITDGQWHRVGLVWDGSSRTLIVDDIAVAEDMQATLESSERGLYIGVGKDFSADSFFSGLIDDIRIYNRAVKP